MGAPVIWVSRNFHSGFSRGQKTVYLIGVVTYMISLFGFLMKFLWQGILTLPYNLQYQLLILQ